MEPLTLKQRQPVEEVDIESWDDGDFDGLDDVRFRNTSTAASIVSVPQLPTRDSTSRMSIRSESNQGDENWDVVVDEQAPIKDAVALARSKGIPLPANVPRSALEGGTIRRLNGKAIKKAISDDWSEDLDIASSEGPLKLAKPEERDINESLRQISAAFRSSPKSPEADLDKTIKSPKSRTAATPLSLDAFRDDDDDDFADVPTIRVAKQRSPGKPTLIKPTTAKTPEIPESIEEGLELPTNGQLRLSSRKAQPNTPQNGDDFDFEWGEGSLGTRNAGRGRAGRSARSSSASALSPSVSSAFTAESEDEGLDGLILPDGPISFKKKLEQRQAEQERNLQDSPVKERPKSVPQAPADDSFFDGLDVGDGEVFSSSKMNLNKNVRTKNQRPISPTKRTTTTLNFTTSKGSASSRLPRFHQPSHERARSSLEPVSESGGPPTRFQRPGSRLGLHSAQSSISAIPAPSTPTPSTPSRRALRSTDSRPDFRHDAPTTTNAQLLRSKRSMPVMRGTTSPTKSDKYTRPPSRAEAGSRLTMSFERPESRSENRKQPVFLPAGASHGQSQHASRKIGAPKGHSRRADSDGTGESMSAAQKSLSRIVALGRPETPGRNRTGVSAADLAAQAKKQVTKPSRRRNYGDGNELDIFDDLPTSASLESKFTKVPIGRGAPRSLRAKFGLGIQSNHSTSTITSLRTTIDTPMPQTPLSPPRQDFPTTATSMATANVPRFARDTAASRNAREQRTISTTFQNIHGEPLKPISANLLLGGHPHTSLQRPHTAGTMTYGPLRKKKNVQQKPHLIKPLGLDLQREKNEKGMRYNPDLFRWEGNENALVPFDIPPPDFFARTGSPVTLLEKDRKAQGSPIAGGNKASVALISNIGNVSGVQVVGGMVFDPSQMRWLKVKEDGPRARGDSFGAQSVEVEEEEDVFAGLDDLKEEGSEWDIKSQSHRGSAAGATPQEYGTGMVPVSNKMSTPSGLRRKMSNESAGSNSDDDIGLDGPIVAEEFDVGPEFVRRQRAEEDRWRRKVEKWLRSPEEVMREGQEGGWLWDVRNVVV